MVIALDNVVGYAVVPCRPQAPIRIDTIRERFERGVRELRTMA